ncbi:beta,beta-carotene 15,15'-dioxygenase-like [Rhinoraja longicauda]
MQSLFGENKRETPEAIKAEIQGEIPKWLHGILIRNGPGIHKIGDTIYNHWFDGLALLHSFTFQNGEVFYRSKYLQSDTYKKNIEANRIVVSEFGTMAYPDPCKNIFAKAFSYLTHVIPDFTDNCLINIIKYGENYYASSEVNYIRRIDPRSLETLEKVDQADYVPLNLATAHPHYDENGNTYNIGTSIGEKGRTQYLIVKVPTVKPAGLVEFLARSEPSMLRVDGSGMAMTLNVAGGSFYLRLSEVVIVWQALVCLALKLPHVVPRTYDQTYIHIVDRRTKKALPTKFCTDALVVYHHVNAYEENNHLIFDIIAYEDNSLYEMFYLANMKLVDNEFETKGKLFTLPHCKRFVIPLDVDENTDLDTNIVRVHGTTAQALKQQDRYVYCTPEVLFTRIELPRINYDYNGKMCRYIYASKVQWQPIPTKIIKCDIQTRSCLEWEEEHCWPAEPVFVKAPDAKDEDDGVLLSCIVCTDAKKSSFLLVLDAKTFKEVGRASVSADVHLDLHGIFIPETELSAKV